MYCSKLQPIVTRGVTLPEKHVRRSYHRCAYAARISFRLGLPAVSRFAIRKSSARSNFASRLELRKLAIPQPNPFLMANTSSCPSLYSMSNPSAPSPIASAANRETVSLCLRAMSWRSLVFGTALDGFESKAFVEVHFMENRAGLGKFFLVHARDVQFIPVVSRFNYHHWRGYTNSAQ